MPDDLTSRIRARAAALSFRVHAGGYVALVRVWDAVLVLCDDEDHRLREQGHAMFVGTASTADLRHRIATALGVPTEHQGGGQ